MNPNAKPGASDGGIVRRRDRAATEQRILEAARRLLSERGFAAFGVNALAEEAGCDKKLISRYFGDLDGVLTELGGDLGFWVGAKANVDVEGGYADRMRALLGSYAQVLQRDIILQRVLAWELVEPSPVFRRLDQVRSAAIGRWVAAIRGDTAPPPDVDAPAINAVLLAALHYLTLRARTVQGFAGLDLTSEAGRARIMAALEHLLMAAYSASETPAGAGPKHGEKQ